MMPDHVESLIHIFDAVVALGHYNVAESIYSSIMNLDSNNYIFYHKYANYCEMIGKSEMAETYYLKSLKINPNFVLGLIDYASFLSKNNQNSIAEK